jgi:hypothetical protein
MHLENEVGAWEGSFSGVYTSETGDMLTVWFTGTGGCAGLSYFQFIEAAPGKVMTGVDYYGFIFPGSSPPRPTPSATASPE